MHGDLGNTPRNYHTLYSAKNEQINTLLQPTKDSQTTPTSKNKAKNQFPPKNSLPPQSILGIYSKQFHTANFLLKARNQSMMNNRLEIKDNCVFRN